MGEMPALVLHKDSAFFLERLTKSLTEVSFHCAIASASEATTRPHTIPLSRRMASEFCS